MTSHYGSRSPSATNATPVKEPPQQQQQQQQQQHQQQQQQQTPLKKRRLSSGDSTESRLNHIPSSAMAFSYENHSQTRIPSRSPLPLQQQQQPRIPYRSESVRATSPTSRVRTPPSNVLQEIRSLSSVSRPYARGKGSFIHRQSPIFSLVTKNTF